MTRDELERVATALGCLRAAEQRLIDAMAACTHALDLVREAIGEADAPAPPPGAPRRRPNERRAA